jgi:hypothetical protein
MKKDHSIQSSTLDEKMKNNEKRKRVIYTVSMSMLIAVLDRLVGC